MDLKDTLQTMAVRLPGQREHIQTEESTKNALVMPLINALGYNVFDPTEVVPEFTADVGIKKGEKVDYAILSDGNPIIIIECKKTDCELSLEYASQLFRYFSVTDARFGVLTDGVKFKFYTDLEKPNQMDSKPFFVFNLENFKDADVEELKKFTKSSFNVDNIQATASELKYTKEIKRIISSDYKEPSEDFVRYCASNVYEGRLTATAKELFSDITKRAFQQFVREQLEEKIDGLNRALDQESNGDTSKVDTDTDNDDQEDSNGEKTRESRIDTTNDEIEGYLIIKAILRDTTEVNRIIMRDTISYCGILLDDNNRKPICRLRFNASQKYLGLFDKEKNETKVPLDDLNDLFQYSSQLKETISYYDNSNSTETGTIESNNSPDGTS